MLNSKKELIKALLDCIEENDGNRARNAGSAEAMYDTVVKKACEWLRKELAGYVYAEYVAEELTGEACISDNMIEDFRKAMED